MIAEVRLQPDETAAIVKEIDLVLAAGLPRQRRLTRPTRHDALHISNLLFEDPSVHIQLVWEGLERLVTPEDPQALTTAWRQLVRRVGHAAHYPLVSFEDGLTATRVMHDRYFPYAGREVHARLFAAQFQGGVLVGNNRYCFDDSNPYFDLGAGPSIGNAASSVNMTFLPARDCLRVRTKHDFDAKLLVPILPGVESHFTPVDTAILIARAVHSA